MSDTRDTRYLLLPPQRETETAGELCARAVAALHAFAPLPADEWDTALWEKMPRVPEAYTLHAAEAQLDDGETVELAGRWVVLVYLGLPAPR